MDENHLTAAARYIERNPVKAHIVKKPYEYAWSSARDHADNARTANIDVSGLFKYIEVEQAQWKAFIDTPDNAEDISIIRKNTMTGRPLGRERENRALSPIRRSR